MMVEPHRVLHYSGTKHPKGETGLFVESDFWNLFGMDSGPGPVWAVLVPLLVLVLPAVVILGCLVVDLIRPGPGSH
jgi:hypothetical protein